MIEKFNGTIHETKPEKWSSNVERDHAQANASDTDRTNAAHARDAAKIIEDIHGSDQPYMALDEARIKHSEAGLPRHHREKDRDYPQSSDHPGLTFEGRNGYGHKATFSAEQTLDAVERELDYKDIDEERYPDTEWKSKLAGERREAAEKSDSLAERKEAWAEVLLDHPIPKEIAKTYDETNIDPTSPEGLVKLEDDKNSFERQIEKWRAAMEKADEVYDRHGAKDVGAWVRLAREAADYYGPEVAQRELKRMENTYAGGSKMIHTNATWTGSVETMPSEVRGYAMNAINASQLMPLKDATEMNEALIDSAKAGRLPTYQELTDFFSQGRMVRRNPSWEQAPEEKAAA